MKNIIAILITIIALPGCQVVFKSYETQEQINKKESALIIENVTISCNLTPADDKDLNIVLWFNKSAKEESIRNITISITPENGQILTSTYVKMTPLAYGYSARFDKKYKKLTFSELPQKDRLTNKNGEEVNYEFSFKSDKNISSKSMIVNVLIELNGRTIQIKDNFILQKHSHFTIH